MKVLLQNRNGLIFAAMMLLTFLPCFAGTKADIKKGQKLFQNMQCAICHTDGGNNLNPERPLKGPLFLKRFPANDNKELEKLIRSGIPTRGMPAFAKDKVSDHDLADLMAYIRSLTPAESKGKRK